MAALTVCSAAACKAQTVRASAQQPKAIAALPRLAAAVGAAAVLLTSTPAFAGDLKLGQQVFDNNCGGLLCLSSSSTAPPSGSSDAVDGDPSSSARPAPTSVDEEGSSGSSSGSSSDPLGGAGSSPPGSSGGPPAPWQRGGHSGRALLRQPLLRIRQPVSLMLMQAACHMGGQNSVIPERTLQKAALEQYLAGGFSVQSIITQVENGKGAMPAWDGTLDDEEIAAVAEYVFKQAEGNLW